MNISCSRFIQPFKQTERFDKAFTQIEPSKEIPIYFDFTIWSVTNADDLASGDMPRYVIPSLLENRIKTTNCHSSFEEAGPYSYRETRRRQNIQVVGGDRAR